MCAFALQNVLFMSKNKTEQFKNFKTAELFKTLNLKVSQFRSLLFSGQKNTKEFKEIKSAIAKLKTYIHNS